MYPSVRVLLILLLSLAGLPAPAAAAATESVLLDAGTDVVRIDGALAWWPDAPAGAGIDVALASADRFVPAPPGPSRGTLAQPAWFRVDVAKSPGDTRALLLEAAFPKTDLLDVWLVHADGRVASWHTGEARPFDSRALPLPRFVFPLPLAPGEQASLFLRVESSTVVILPLTVYDQHAYLAASGSVRGWLGLFYGLVLGVIAYNAFLFRTTRDPAFFHYTVASVLAVGYFASVDGYVSMLLPDAPGVAQRVLFIAGSLSVTFTLLFARLFLALSRVAPRLDRAMLVVAGAAAVATLLVPVVPLLVALGYTIGLSLAMAVLMGAAGVVSLRAGFRPARWFVLAIGVHFVVLLLVSAGATGIDPDLFATADLAHRVGFVLNLLCFTLALGERIQLTEQQRRQAEEAAFAAEAQVRARNDFLSRMSHELRTPMTGVLGMAELLDHTDLAPQQRRYLSTLRYSGEMLLHLINDVLDHARLEAGRLQLRQEGFDLLRLVDECRLLFEQQPRDNGVTLRIDLGDALPRVVVGDVQRLRQMLVNLLAVAFRATSRGAVVLRVRRLDRPGWVRFEVEDAGGAPAANELVQLFEPMPPAGQPGNRRLAGGLGLGTCRRLAVLMGGTVDAVAGGDGAVFRLDLPLNAGH